MHSLLYPIHILLLCNALIYFGCQMVCFSPCSCSQNFLSNFVAMTEQFGQVFSNLAISYTHNYSAGTRVGSC